MWAHRQPAFLSVSLSKTDYWNPEDDYWGPEPTPSRAQPEAPITDPPYNNWRTDAYEDYFKPDEEDPAALVTDAYDEYWNQGEKEVPTSAPSIYDDYMKPDEKDPYTSVTDNYDGYWQEVDRTSAAPEVDAKPRTDDSDYWDATCMYESVVSLFLLRMFVWVSVYETWIRWWNHNYICVGNYGEVTGTTMEQDQCLFMKKRQFWEISLTLQRGCFQDFYSRTSQGRGARTKPSPDFQRGPVPPHTPLQGTPLPYNQLLVTNVKLFVLLSLTVVILWTCTFSFIYI